MSAFWQGAWAGFLAGLIVHGAIIGAGLTILTGSWRSAYLSLVGGG